MIGILQFKKNIKDKEDYQEVKVLLHGLHKKKKQFITEIIVTEDKSLLIKKVGFILKKDNVFKEVRLLIEIDHNLKVKLLTKIEKIQENDLKIQKELLILKKIKIITSIKRKDQNFQKKFS